MNEWKQKYKCKKTFFGLEKDKTISFELSFGMIKTKNVKNVKASFENAKKCQNSKSHL